MNAGLLIGAILGVIPPMVMQCLEPAPATDPYLYTAFAMPALFGAMLGWLVNDIWRAHRDNSR